MLGERSTHVLDQRISELSIGVFEDLTVELRNRLLGRLRCKLAIFGDGSEMGRDLLWLLFLFVPDAGGC